MPTHTERRVLQTLTDTQLRVLFTFKPRTFPQLRAYTLAILLMDKTRNERMDATNDPLFKPDLEETVEGPADEQLLSILSRLLRSR